MALVAIRYQQATAPRCDYLRGDLMGARHRISRLLLRHGVIFEGPGATWSHRHLKWLNQVRFEQPLVEVVFGEYLAHHQVLLARRDRLDRLLLEQSVQWPWAPTVGPCAASTR